MSALAVTRPEPAAVTVLIADDSAVARGANGRVVEQLPGFRVAGSVCDGAQAVAWVTRTPIDVVLIDIEMPVMDGLTALPQLLAARPGVKVIVISSLTTRGAEASLRALSLGAFDVLAKPLPGEAAAFAQELGRKLAACRAALRRSNGPAASIPPAPPAAGPRARPNVLAFASSTGGPQALLEVFARLPRRLNVPVMVTQHMPPTFTEMLARRLGEVANLPAGEGVDGEALRPGRIYVAPGGRHMGLGEGRTIRLLDGPPENFCRPAADPMLRDLAARFGPAVMAVVLTGMGSDGARGAGDVVRAGGRVIVQDEATSVVWGMPGAVARGGLAEAVLPLAAIPAYVAKALDGPLN